MNTRLLSLLTTVALVAGADWASSAENDLAPIKAEIAKRHDEAVKRLQDWIAQVSIAAENRGYGMRRLHGEARTRCRISAGDRD